VQPSFDLREKVLALSRGPLSLFPETVPPIVKVPRDHLTRRTSTMHLRRGALGGSAERQNAAVRLIVPGVRGSRGLVTCGVEGRRSASVEQAGASVRSRARWQG
jgi:hypothetical protein